MDAGIGYTDVETNREQEGYAMAVYMGEEEVIQKNMALAQEKVYTVEDLSLIHICSACPPSVMRSRSIPTARRWR